MGTGLTEYAAGFQYTENERGINVTRVFHYDPDSTDNADVELPKPGDRFTFPFTGNITDITYMDTVAQNDKNNVICRERTMTPLAGDQRKYQWTVTYNNEPVDQSVFAQPSEGVNEPTDISNLPMTLEYSGEFMLINPTASSGWKWSDNTAVSQPLPKRINTSTLRIVRYVRDTEYSGFQNAVRSAAGTVNYTEDPFGIGGGKGCWLFVGVTTEYFRNNSDAKWWRAELEFMYRNPDDTDEDGWQKIMKPDGTWDKPTNGSGYLYTEGDFLILFNASTE